MIWLKRTAGVIGVVLLLWVIAWVAVPPLLKWQAQTRLSELLDRSVTLGDVSFQPWRMELTLNDIVVRAASGPASPLPAAALPASGAAAPSVAAASSAEPLLRVARVRANLALWPLFRRVPVVEALDIEAARVSVARLSPGHYDVDDLIDKFTRRPDQPAAELTQFALYNLQVRDAQLRFDDRPVGRIQRIDALQLALPFISNLPDEVQVKVEPHLAFKLNGASFDSGAQATPFAQTKTGELKLAMADLDLAPYLGYLPASLPVRVTRGSVSAALSLQFAVPQTGAPSVALKGKVGANDVALTDASGAPLLGWQRLQLGLSDVQPLARNLTFGDLRIDALQLQATRDAAGKIDLLSLAAPRSGQAPAVAPASAASSAQAPAAPGWQIGLDTLELAAAQIRWNDAAVKPAVMLQLDGLTLSAKQVHWPIAAPIAVTLSGALRAQGNGTPALAEFAAEGPVTDHDAKLGLRLTGLSLAAFGPYLSGVLVPSVDGQVAAQAQLDWSAAADAPRLRLAIDALTLDALKLREGKGRTVQDAVALKQLALADLKVDVLGRSVEIGNVKLAQPTLNLARDKAGRLNLQGWVPAPAPAKERSHAGAPASAAPWRVRLNNLQLDGGDIRFSDAAVRGNPGAEPLRVALTNLSVGLQGFEWQGDHAVAPAQLQLSARIGAPQRERSRPTGLLDYKGRVGMLPLLVGGRLRLERFPVHLFAPYFADQLPLSLLRAEAGYTGSLALRALPGGLDASAGGDVLLGDVHVATLPDAGAVASAANTDELLGWQSLALKRVKVVMKPKSKPQIDIGEAALTDFYSRLVVTEQGHFNLQDMGRTPAGAAIAADSSVPAPAVTATAASAAGVPALADSALPLDIRVGATTLTNGRVDFTDHFVRPNYSAALTELNGRLGAFSSTSRDMATIELRGRAEGTALLEIGGSLNPTVKPLALDIHAKATDLELAPLSPYAGKYAGYAIERGKLSMDVTYKIDADGKLEASNQLVLNQLTFGDRIESKDATKLPVLLAVALLKDRNGVIDINLPISGSINDPKFSVGGIIVKVIINLLTKAITAPFALLAGAGKDDLSLVEFRPGTATIAASSVAAIDKVAQALNDRPSLRMTVTGAADPASERDAIQEAAIEARLRAEQRREALRASAPAPAASASAPLSDEERTRLLKQVYKDTDIPNKPRNALGFAKDIPAAEMMALLKTRAPVTDESARELALQRGLAVRDALIAKGLPGERLFLAAPKLHAAGEGDAVWTPRVQLTLSTK